MHRHDTDFPAPLFHVALDFRATTFNPVQKAFQRWRVFAFIGEGERQEFLDGIAGLGGPSRAKSGLRKS